MKLSEAIRLGAMMGPQINGLFFGAGDASCSLGAAAKACSVSVDDLGRVWPWLEEGSGECPGGCGMTYTQSGGTIVCLNDIHRWTRERIADWVATIEPEEVHASETIREVQVGQGPLRSTPEEETFETITK